MKFKILFYMFILFALFPIATHANTTTEDTIIVDVPEETTTNDTIIVTPSDEFNMDEAENDPRIYIKFIDKLLEVGNTSNGIIEHVVFNLSNVENGIIVATYYSGADKIATTKTINVTSNNITEARNLVSRFALNLSVRYRPHARYFIANQYTENSTDVYIFGEQKINAVQNLLNGVHEAFDNNPVRLDDDNDWVDKYNPVLVNEEVKILTLEEIEAIKSSLVEINNQVAEYISDNKYVQFFINTVLSIFY